ncbi:MAG: LytTR family DNA-binding domain-containing protein [Woeseiaceae bacterium]|nr:LytTR family DNA-binding domain-containing protein [Woeseiaceae bacterium]
MAVLRPFASRIVAAGAGLSLLFTLLAPESSAPLTFVPRLVFWVLHIGIGLSAAVLVAKALLAVRPSTKDWVVVVMSGLGGVVLFAPLAIGIESLFPLGGFDGDNDFMEKLARSSLAMAIVVEALEMTPPFMAAWLLINLEPVRAVITNARTAKATEPEATVTERQGDAGEGASADACSPEMQAFLDRLPPIIGTDIVCVSSDLHYLNVTTRQGQAMILGSLQELEDAFGDQGLRVHRSHWVYIDAVVSLSKSGKGWFLNLVGENRVPVSRRKRNEIAGRLGEDFLKNHLEKEKKGSNRIRKSGRRKRGRTELKKGVEPK